MNAYAGPAGLVLVLLLFVATFFLVRNMDKRVKRLPPEFPPEAPTAGDEEPRPGG